VGTVDDVIANLNQLVAKWEAIEVNKTGVVLVVE